MARKNRFSIFVLLWSWAFFLRRRMLIRINYKTGIQEEFWAYWFWKQLDGNNSLSQLQWKPVNANQPFILGIDDIESVWVVETRGMFSMPERLKPTS